MNSPSPQIFQISTRILLLNSLQTQQIGFGRRTTFRFLKGAWNRKTPRRYDTASAVRVSHLLVIKIQIYIQILEIIFRSVLNLYSEENDL